MEGAEVLGRVTMPVNSALKTEQGPKDIRDEQASLFVLDVLDVP